MTDVQILRIQKEELDSLNFIYLSDLEILRNTFPSKFAILCRPFSDISEDEYKTKIIFQFTKQYPRTAIRFQVQPIVGITQDNIAAIQRKIDSLLDNNKNKPVVYDIVEAARDWIQEFLVEGKGQVEEQEQQKVIQQVFERPKYATYTPVTVENFMNWKRQFEAQMNQAKRKRQMELQEKLSGKQWFMKNKQIQQSEQEEEEESEQEEQETEKVIPNS